MVWKPNMAGSANLWAAWLDEHGAALVLLARHWTPSLADAEDAVQEAFVRCWQGRERVADPVAYLYASVKHCALDAQRGRLRRQRREQVISRPEAEPMFDAPVEQDERRAAIEAALRNLSATQAEVLILKIWGGLSFPQIGAALEIPANTAASRYRYALAKLREHLATEMVL